MEPVTDTQERPMKYLLSIYQPVGPPPSPELLRPVMEKVNGWAEELKSKGQWVFSAGLHPTETSTVVRVSDGEALITDGPYVEGKEHIGGFTIIDADDLDVALVWARKLSEALTLPGMSTGLAVEIRPLSHGG
jgi:hypothetical protein